MQRKDTEVIRAGGDTVANFPGADSSRCRRRRHSSRRPAAVNDPVPPMVQSSIQSLPHAFSLAAGSYRAGRGERILCGPLFGPAVNVYTRGARFLFRAPGLVVWLGLMLLAVSGVAPADQHFTPQVYMEIAEAPRAVFPKTTAFERRDIKVTPEMSQKFKALVGQAKPTIWENSYITFIARDAQGIVGYAVICEEIGKHYPMTFIVGVTPAGEVHDVAMIAYREPQGGEVRYKNFMKQFHKKSLKSPIMPYKDIVNISGATLSTRAMARGVRKALAVIQTLYLEDAAKSGKGKP